MKASEKQVTVKVGFSPEVFVAIEVIGLGGEKLPQEMKRVLAIDLYKRGLLSVGKAAELAEMGLAHFTDLLVEEDVMVVEYTADDLKKDLETLERLES